jgi:probable F420-dependent oxidoreductase
MQLGRVGLWTGGLQAQPAERAGAIAADVESLGYRTLWIPEAMGREAFTFSALLLSATSTLNVATGVAQIWARAAAAAAAAHKTIEECFPDRFLLGLGVSHQPFVEGVLGLRYERPFTAMRTYLDAMDAAPYVGPAPSTEPRRALGALGAKMLALAAERSAGAHPYLVPVEHTVVAREVLGDGPWLMPEQWVALETDAERARALGRRHLSTYLGLPNYTNNLRRLGFGDDDLAGRGSDRLVDALVAWGSEDAILARVRGHLDAGADHVAVQVLTEDIRAVPLDAWTALAPALLSVT